jgi:putative SOS response-associated peptidase YedK
MCGRYKLVLLSELTSLFPWIKVGPRVEPRYNIAPTQPILMAANDPVAAEFKFDFALWGLIPSWAKDPSIGSRMINARAETLQEKPSFRTALRRRRCLIPADGFYEWRRNDDGSKTPMHIRLKSGKPFAFAGLWDAWHDPAGGGEVRSGTIITGAPNALMAPIHNRMPIIVPAALHQQWLSPNEVNPADLRSVFEPYPADEMEAFAVSNKVNSPRNDSQACVEPATDSQAPGLW